MRAKMTGDARDKGRKTLKNAKGTVDAQTNTVEAGTQTGHTSDAATAEMRPEVPSGSL